MGFRNRAGAAAGRGTAGERPFPPPGGTGPAGDIAFSFNYPGGIPRGLTVYAQYWILDPSGPLGATASNAITATSE